jgi:hypothetical protein
MLALGSRLLKRSGDLDTAREITQTCYYVVSPSFLLFPVKLLASSLTFSF